MLNTVTCSGRLIIYMNKLRFIHINRWIILLNAWTILPKCCKSRLISQVSLAKKRPSNNQEVIPKIGRLATFLFMLSHAVCESLSALDATLSSILFPYHAGICAPDNLRITCSGHIPLDTTHLPEALT